VGLLISGCVMSVSMCWSARDSFSLAPTMCNCGVVGEGARRGVPISTVWAHVGVEVHGVVSSCIGDFLCGFVLCALLRYMCNRLPVALIMK
jgi:hypothetical protein